MKTADRYYSTFFVISVIFHLFVGILIVKLFSINRLHFDYEEKEITVTVVKNPSAVKKLIKKLKKREALHTPETAPETEAADSIDTNLTLNEQVDLSVSQKEYNPGSRTGKSKPMESVRNSGFEEDDFDFDIDKELELLDNSPIRFENGEYRKIVVDLRQEFSKLDFIASTQCRVRIVIDETGTVIHSEILESTGELENDSQILALVNRWKFEESSLKRQTAVVEMKYYFR